jgi:hypothetical protein
MTETNDELRQAYENFDRCCRSLDQAIEATKGPMTEGRRRAMTDAVSRSRQRKVNAELRLRSLLEVGHKSAREQWLSQFDGGLYPGQTIADAIGRIKPKAARLVDMAFNAGWLAARNASVGDIVKLRRHVEQAEKKAQSQAEKIERLVGSEIPDWWQGRAKFTQEGVTLTPESEEETPAENAPRVRASGHPDGYAWTFRDGLQKISEGGALPTCESGVWHPDDTDADNAESVIEQALADIRSGNLGDITRAIVILAEVDEGGHVYAFTRSATKNSLETLGMLAAALDDAQCFPTRKADRG